MDNKKAVVNQFAKNAGKYVTSTVHAKGDDLALILEIAKENKGSTLLDIATGGGHVANTLAPLYEEVVALDLTPEMLEKAKQFIETNGHANVSFIQGDAEALPFPDKTFNTVTCRIAPHHFPHIDQFISEAYRVLKENGIFIVVDNIAPESKEFDQFYNYIEKKRDPSHYRAYKKTEWISLLEHAGFEVEALTAFKKKFSFDWWCDMMDLPEKDKTELNEYIVSAPTDIIEFFFIEIKDERVQIFKGCSMLLVARKRG